MLLELFFRNVDPEIGYVGEKRIYLLQSFSCGGIQKGFIGTIDMFFNVFLKRRCKDRILAEIVRLRLADQDQTYPGLTRPSSEGNRDALNTMPEQAS